MKQRISAEQLNELSDKGKEKLRVWWKPKWHDIFVWTDKAVKDKRLSVTKKDLKEPRNMLWTNYSEESPELFRDRNDGNILPLLSIGQLIEFLDDKRDRQLQIGKCKDGWNLPEERVHEDETKELIDCLWRACKEVLK